MDTATLKDLLRLLPDSMCFDKTLLKPYFGGKPPEYSYIINDSTFYDNVGKFEDTKLVHFEILKEDRESEIADAEVKEIVEDTENATSQPEVTIEKADNGVIVNSKTYLNDQNWNTLLSLDGLFQCVVCDKIMIPDSVDAHITTNAHKDNLERSRPLTEFEQSIIRKIEYYYHCGVCNLLTIHIHDHVVMEEHKRNLIHAVNKANEIRNKNLDKTGNGPNAKPVTVNDTVKDIVNETKPEIPVNDVKVKDDTRVDKAIGNLAIPKPSVKKVKKVQFKIPNLIPDKRKVLKINMAEFPDLTKSNRVARVNPIMSNQDTKPGKDPVEAGEGSKSLGKVDTSTYATALKKVVTLPPEFVFYTHKGVMVKIKYDSWHMILRLKGKTFYCMACTERDVKDKLSHCCEQKHTHNLAKCTIVDAYQDFFVRKVSDKFFHCGHCNNLQYPQNMDTHVSKEHPNAKKITVGNEIKQPDPTKIEYEANAKNVKETLSPRSTPESAKSPPIADNDQIKNKPANIFTSQIKIRPFDLEITLNVLYYNAVLVYGDKLVCGLCDCFIEEDPVKHICGTRHTEILRLTPFVAKYNNNLIREVRDKLHCALCNVYIPHENVFTHIMNPPHTTVLTRATTLAQIRVPQGPTTPHIRPPPKVLYAPTVQVPNMNAVTNTMYSWWQSAPRFVRNHMPIVSYRAPMVFPGQVPGHAFSPYVYPISRPMMPIQNMTIPKATVPTNEAIEKECASKASCTEQAKDGEIKEIKNEKTTTKKVKDKLKKADGVVKDGKKIKDSPAKKKSVINEIKRSVDQLKANEIMNTNEKDDINSDLKKNETKDTYTFTNEEQSLIKIDDTIRLRKSFSDVAKMAPKEMAAVKPDSASVITKFPSYKKKVIGDDNKIVKDTSADSDKSLKIVDVMLNKKIIFDINKKEYSTSITPNNEWLLKEERLQKITDENKNYSLDNNFTLVTKKSAKIQEVKETFDQVECDTENPGLTSTVESEESTKDKGEITLDDIKMVSELYEPVEQTNTHENTATETVEKAEKKVTFEAKKQGSKKGKANENQAQVKNKTNAANKNQNKKANESNTSNKKKSKGKTPPKTETVENEAEDDSKVEIAANDDASSITDVTEVKSDDSYDVEEFIYLNFKSFVAKITFSAYNSLVPVGDGSRYCFVCWEEVINDLKRHVESTKHLENMKSSKYMDHYNDNMIRWKNSTHHCSVCNVIITGSLQTHFSWQHHAATLLETKKTARQQSKDMKKTTYKQFQAFTTKKNYTCSNPVKLKKSDFNDFF